MTLFDAAGESNGPDARPVSVVRLSALIAKAASEIGRIAVEGEIHRPTSGTGRQWFTLRDRAAQVSVTVPAGRRARCRVVAGERVCVTGRLEWVPSTGQLQLVAEEVVPVGAGAIAAMIADARRRLDADGLLTRPRRPIPRLPAVIAVVCGREAAVRADIESVVAARFAGYPVVFVETTVSGPGATDHIIAALADLDGRPEVEVIILARGGGDATQLLPFSEEQLCRAVCASSTPVVAAIGHDGDRPLVDEVADLRCGTPSLAAAAVVPDEAGLRAEVDRLVAAVTVFGRDRLSAASAVVARIDRRAACQLGLERAATRLRRAADQRALVHPTRELELAIARLGRVAWRGPAPGRLAGCERQLAGARAQADGLSPTAVLQRGYALVRRADDASVVRAPAQAPPGTLLEVVVAAGSLSATVEPRP